MHMDALWAVVGPRHRAGIYQAIQMDLGPYTSHLMI